MFLLFVCLIFDIKKRKIPAMWIWICISLMAIYRIYLFINAENTIGDFIFSIMPGVMIYLLSQISNEIGNGDGLLLIATGCFFTWEKHLGMIIMAFFMAAVFSISLIIMKRDINNKRIPFVPFLFVATGMTLFL